MFKSVGSFNCEILDVKFTKTNPKFNAPENAFNICVKVQDNEDKSQVDWWEGEYSDRYGRGVCSDTMQMVLTMNSIRNCGFEGDDFSTMPKQLIGKTVPVDTYASKPTGEDNKVFYNIGKIGGSGKRLNEEISFETVAKLAASMTDEAPGEIFDDPATVATVTPSDVPADTDDLPF